MLISELQAQLEKIKQERGDLTVKAAQAGIVRQDGRFPEYKIEGVKLIDDEPSYYLPYVGILI